jgi:hypothetical protein
MRYGERFYCSCGKRRYLNNSKEVQPGMVCPDWYRCRGLNWVIENKKQANDISYQRRDRKYQQ